MAAEPRHQRRETSERAPDPGTGYAPEPIGEEPPSGAPGGREVAGVTILAGLWLIVSPWVLDYTAADAAWNPVVSGLVAIAFALARIVGFAAASVTATGTIVVGLWLLLSSFWLAESSQASWNVGLTGIAVMILGALSLSMARASAPGGRRDRPPDGRLL